MFFVYFEFDCFNNVKLVPKLNFISNVLDILSNQLFYHQWTNERINGECVSFNWDIWIYISEKKKKKNRLSLSVFRFFHISNLYMNCMHVWTYTRARTPFTNVTHLFFFIVQKLVLSSEAKKKNFCYENWIKKQK